MRGAKQAARAGAMRFLACSRTLAVLSLSCCRRWPRVPPVGSRARPLLGPAAACCRADFTMKDVEKLAEEAAKDKAARRK